jgi:hypothetical protein
MGDFERNNEFYADDYIVCRREKLEVTPAPDAHCPAQRAPFIRDQTI